jgi:hypothetical protein
VINKASESLPPPGTNRFAKAIARFDEENAQDPNLDSSTGRPTPRELLYAQRLSEWVLRLCPDASEVLQLAARSQHLCRWKVPPNTYPMTRAGYLQWRAGLKQFHAEKSGEILQQLQYPESTVRRVQDLNLKRHFPNDPESRVLEDALCLVFLQFQFPEVATKLSEEKTVNALRKSWAKMTPAAQQIALTLHYAPREHALLQKALASDGN